MIACRIIALGLLTILLASLCAAFPSSRGRRNYKEEQIVKSVSDENEYRAITLSNKIRCVVVSDTSTEIAAVEVRVASGYLAEDTPGLAHFVEHMIFEGSEEHPGNDYQIFVKERGGSFNGATWESATTYMFTIRDDSWVEAARMLASFIGNPSFPRDTFASAIEAVDSEYKMSLHSDYRALYALAMKLANPKNRYREFSTGSKETLNLTDIYEQSVEFHDKFYSANLITLAIVANASTDRLETLADNIFGKIPNKNIEKAQNSALPFPTNDKRYLGKKVYFKTKTNTDQISLLFPINMENFVSVQYVLYLLDHEGKGSIYQYLLSRGYATQFGSFVSLEDSQTIPIIVYCQPTQKGIEDPSFIVEAVFKYLKEACSKGVNVELWESVKELNELEFRFQAKSDPEDLVSNILDEMGITNDARKYLGAPSQLTLDIKVENEILSYLHPDNFNLFIGSSSFSESHATSSAPQLTKNEYYYNTPYLDVDLTEEQLEVLRNVKSDPELHLPQPNTFIPNNFEIYDIEEDAGGLPKEIVSRDEDDISIWWYQDQEWKQPTLYTGCMVFPAQVTRGAKTWALEGMIHDIYGFVKDLALYEAWEADFNPVVQFGESWTISVNGYSDAEKVEDVLNKMLDVLFHLEFDMDQALFNSTVVRPTQDYYDEEHGDSYYYAQKYLESVRNKDFVDWSDVKNIAGEISQSDVKEYMINFLRDVSVTCSVVGNAKKEHAIRYSTIVKEKILQRGSLIQNVDRREMRDQYVYKIPAGPSHVIRRRMENIDQVTSTTLVIFQIDRMESNGGINDSPSYTVFAFAELLELIMGQTCFSYLRTERQLGYMAYCGTRLEQGVSNFYFGVQGSRPDAGPDVYDREINSLIVREHEKLRSMGLSPDGIRKFDELKTALSDKISIKPRTLSEKSSEFNSEIYSSTRDFKKIEKKVAAISAMTVDKLLDLFGKYIVGNGRRKISSQVYGPSHEMPSSSEAGEILIEDIAAFKQQLSETF